MKPLPSVKNVQGVSKISLHTAVVVLKEVWKKSYQLVLVNIWFFSQIKTLLTVGNIQGVSEMPLQTAVAENTKKLDMSL